MMTDLNEQCALQCEGYVRAGVARNGQVMLHPPGERNRSVPVPAYTEDWQACMRLVWRYRMVVSARAVDHGGPLWEIGAEADEGRMAYTFWATDAEARQAIVEAACGRAR